MYREYCYNKGVQLFAIPLCTSSCIRIREVGVMQKNFTAERGLQRKYETNGARKFHAWQMKKMRPGKQLHKCRQRNCWEAPDMALVLNAWIYQILPPKNTRKLQISAACAVPAQKKRSPNPAFCVGIQTRLLSKNVCLSMIVAAAYRKPGFLE